MRRIANRLHAVCIAALFLAATGCNTSGCSILEPMPEGVELPRSQTLEGGIQTRITPAGFAKISALIPPMVEGFASSVAIPTYETGFSAFDLTICESPCPVTVTIPEGGAVISSDGQSLFVDVTTNLYIPLQFSADVFGIGLGQCTLGVGNAAGRPFHFKIGIKPTIRESDGELRVLVDSVDIVDLQLDLGVDQSHNPCNWGASILDPILDALASVVNFITDSIAMDLVEMLVNYLLPYLQSSIDAMMPDPLGLEGQFDIGSMVKAFSPGAEGKLELRLTPGGYANLLDNGFSLGVITGVNADYDPSTRIGTAWQLDPNDPASPKQMYHSQGHPKMPKASMPTPDLANWDASNISLQSSRQTYVLNIAQELSGAFDNQALVYRNPNNPLLGQTADVGIGVSQHFMNLLGYHALNSGALNLEIGTEQVSMLTVGLFAILIEGLVDIVDPEVGDAPLRLVIRPQSPAEFTVRDNLADPPEPLLQITVNDFEIDMYPFTEGRYSRALTLGVNLSLGIDLATDFRNVDNPTADGTDVCPNFGADPDCKLHILPAVFVPDGEGMAPTVRIHNSELIKEYPAELEALLPGMLNMLMPMIGSFLPPIPMPEFSGMSLEQIEFRQADNDTIMLILANIKAPSGKPGLPPQAPVEGEARLEEVYVPTPERLRATLKDHTVPQAEKDLPYVRIVTTATNHAAADVEWTYRLDRGPWRTFRDGPELLLRDPAFYFQGWHQIDVRGRLKGHPLTLGRVVGSFKVLMDSMAPLQQARVEDGELELGGFDFVTPREDLEYSVEKAPGQFSAWTPGSRMTLEQARALAAANDGVLRVRCRDASGNVSTAEVSLRKLGETELPTADQVAAGCGCAQTPGADAGWLLALLGLALLGLRRRRAAGLLVVAAAAGLGLGLAGCSKTAGHQPDGGLPPCTLHTECSVLQCQPSTHCGVNAVPLCIQGQCECGEELKVGSAGSHSSLAVANNTVLVAAYNDCWGDLMVGRVARTDVGQNTIVYDNQWEFVDGIPWQNDPEVPTSTVRGGQRRKGEKVGRFTAVSHDAAANPVVAYYDVDRGALKYARHDGTAWKIMFVDFVGVDLDDDEPWDGDVGRYAVISMRGTERTPGIVYLAQFLPTEAPTTYRSELRYAQATTANPSTPADWEIFILDAVDVIAPTDQQGNPLEPVSWPLGDWPKGLGVTSAIERTSDGRPVIVYYDSVNGNLKAVEHDGTTFTAPIILDGEAEDGTDTGNRGLFPSLKLDPVDPTIWHVVYVDVDRKQLRYLRSSDPVVSEVIDDGLREEQNPITGLPMPVSHMVGYDAKIVVVQDDVYVAYQDATTHELRWATPRTDTCRVGGVDQRCWDLEVIKGDKPVELDPNGGYTGYEGAYGFYVNLVLDANTAFISTYVINEWDEGDPMMGRPPMNQWVEIFARQLTPG